MNSKATFAALILSGLAALPAAAQDVTTDPLQCWWRTSAGAVKVGEPFTAVLTCAVLETDDVKVVVDESRLEPSVVQFAPFETLGGSHAADLRNDTRRFFQYEYRLRLIAENLFGKDVALPETKLSYRVQSKVAARKPGGGPSESIAGRDQTYLLPPLSVRLLSLVPADASDIRDASAETFGDIDQRAFRANLFVVIGGVLFALAALLAVLAVVRAIMRTRKPATSANRLVGDGAILRSVGRELAAVQRQRNDLGWTPELAARALAALRIIATYAIGRAAARLPMNGAVSTARAPLVGAPRPVPNGAETVASGGILVSTGWRRSRKIAVSGAATPQSIARAAVRLNGNGSAADLEAIEQALTRFTAAQYGRPIKEGFDDVALDESVAAGQRLLRRLKLDQIWPMSAIKRWRNRGIQVETGQRVWSR